MPELGRAEVIRRLRAVGAWTKPGDPIPDFLDEFNNWGVALAQLCARAADELERPDHKYHPELA